MEETPIISRNIRLRYPDHFDLGAGSIVDDFCYLSTRIRIGRHCHVASSCSIAGGKEGLFVLGDYSSLSSGVKVWTSSDDFTHDLVMIVPEEFGEIKTHSIRGDVVMGSLTGVGANSVVMPDNRIPEGTVIGALSFVPSQFEFEPWTVYAGTPIRRIKARDREGVLAQLEALERKFEAESIPAVRMSC
jgi:acetyltransferase-like isoleucine patch superfamily enzyme